MESLIIERLLEVATRLFLAIATITALWVTKRSTKPSSISRVNQDARPTASKSNEQSTVFYALTNG